MAQRYKKTTYFPHKSQRMTSSTNMDRTSAVPAMAVIAGIASALSARQFLNPAGPGALSCAASLACAMLAVCSLVMLSNRDEAWTRTFPAFLCGIMCALGWMICGGLPEQPSSVLARRLGSALEGAIDSAGFRGEETPALIRALIAGDRSDVSPEMKRIFRESGASHLLALSGLHLGIIYALISRGLSIAGNSPAARKLRGGAIIIFALAYCIATGASPSILRAFLFISLRELSKMSGRRNNPLQIYCSALMIQLVLLPGSLAKPGFQLSYAAMCGIYTVFPHLKGFYPSPQGRRRGPVKWIWDMASLSISCQIFTAPLAWYHFHSFPLCFMLTNLLSMPLSTVLIATAFITVMLSGLGICPDFLPQVCDRLCEWMLFTLRTISAI